MKFGGFCLLATPFLPFTLHCLLLAVLTNEDHGEGKFYLPDYNDTSTHSCWLEILNCTLSGPQPFSSLFHKVSHFVKHMYGSTSAMRIAIDHVLKQLELCLIAMELALLQVNC